MQAEHWVQTAGYIASALVFATFCMKTMTPLRVVAICSNAVFITYGALAHIYPVLILHLVLLPLNGWRTWKLISLERKLKAAVAGGFSVEWLKPFMTGRSLAAGEVLFRRGDEADNLYMLLSGEVLLVEIDHRLKPGDLFGEIALFSTAHRRTQTAIAEGDVELLFIGEKQLSQVCYQNPGVALYFLRLTTNRLLANFARVEPARQDAGAASR